MLSRLLLTIINLIFPPLSILLLTGPYTDTLLNRILFLCGVIPSHIHGFYINCTYYHRKNKVRKGKWPGGPKTLIFDRKVWRGGASVERVRDLWEEKEGKKGGNGVRRSGSGSRRRSHGHYASDRRSQVGYRGDRRNEMREHPGQRRSIMGEMGRSYY